MDDGELLARAGRLARRYATGDVGCEADDLQQVALLAGYQARDEWMPERSVEVEAHVTRRMQFAVIDELRRVGPVTQDGNERRPHSDIEDFDVYLEQRGERDEGESALPERIPKGFRLRKREWRILKRLADGANQRQVAQLEGVTENRISQIVRGLRKRFVVALEEERNASAQPERTPCALGPWPTRCQRTEALSDRELLVLKAAGLGLSQDATADRFGISTWTALTYRRRAIKKTRARNLTHAYTIAWRHGLLR